MRVWGMHERTQIELSAADRAELKTIVANRNSPQKHVWRAKIVLLTADGHGTAEISGEPERPRPSSGAGKNGLAPKASPPCGGTRRGPRASRRWLPRLPSAWWP
jgi:hypothetical protein